MSGSLAPGRPSISGTTSRNSIGKATRGRLERWPFGRTRSAISTCHGSKVARCWSRPSSKAPAAGDFFGTAYGEHEGKFDGFKLGDANVQLDDTLLLIEPEAAAQYATSVTPSAPQQGTTGGSGAGTALVTPPQPGLTRHQLFLLTSRRIPALSMATSQSTLPLRRCV